MYVSKKWSSMKIEAFRGEMEALENYLELNNVQQEVKKRCKTQLQLLHQWDIEQPKGEEVFGRLPSALQAKVFEARMEDLEKNDYFAQFSPKALRKIVLKAKVELYLGRDELRGSIYAYMLLSGDVRKESRANKVEKWDLLMGDDEIWNVLGTVKSLKHTQISFAQGLYR